MTLLKKRLFSSPAAFLRTLEVHRATLLRERRPAPPPTPTVLQRLFDDAANALDEEASEDGVGDAAREAIEAAATAEQSRPTAEELQLLDNMITWAQRAAVTEDARTTRLLDWVEENVKPNGRFSDQRVIMFSEYRATQRYLQERLPPAASRASASSFWTAPPTTTSASESRASGRNRPATTRCGSCWRPTLRRRASRCSATAIYWLTLRFRGTPTAWSSATAASTVMASLPRMCWSTTALAQAGKPAGAARLTGTSTFSRVS